MHATAVTDRDGDAATTEDRDTDRRGNDASSTSGDKRNGEKQRDQLEQANMEAEARADHEGNGKAAKGRAIEETRQQDGLQEVGRAARNHDSGHHATEEDDGYFTARGEPTAEATNARARRASSESPSVASPLRPRRLEAQDRGKEERQRQQKA